MTAAARASSSIAFDFAGKAVLVVGGSSGIGNGVAQAFRAAGAQVQVWGTRPSAADYAGVGGSDLTELVYAQVDVSAATSVESAAASLARLDVLVLSQGGPMHDGVEFEMANFERVLDLNLTSAMRCATLFRPSLAASGGSVVVISSIAAFSHNHANPAYAAGKAGVVRLVEVLGAAWAVDGIRVNSVAPGLVLTKVAKASTDPELLARARTLIPMRRPGSPAEMAAAALFLASPLASYITGQTLRVDGGLSL